MPRFALRLQLYSQHESGEYHCQFGCPGYKKRIRNNDTNLHPACNMCQMAHSEPSRTVCGRSEKNVIRCAITCTTSLRARWRCHAVGSTSCASAAPPVPKASPSGFARSSRPRPLPRPLPAPPPLPQPSPLTHSALNVLLPGCGASRQRHSTRDTCAAQYSGDAVLSTSWQGQPVARCVYSLEQHM